MQYDRLKLHAPPLRSIPLRMAPVAEQLARYTVASVRGMARGDGMPEVQLKKPRPSRKLKNVVEGEEATAADGTGSVGAVAREPLCHAMAITSNVCEGQVQSSKSMLTHAAVAPAAGAAAWDDGTMASINGGDFARRGDTSLQSSLLPWPGTERVLPGLHVLPEGEADGALPTDEVAEEAKSKASQNPAHPPCPST
jgi:hypothetical protein